MKSATTKLISFSKITTSSISRNFTTKITCSSSSIETSCTQTLKPCSNSNTLFYKPYKTQQFHINPSQNYITLVGDTPYFPPIQRKIKKTRNIMEVFDEALEGFKKLDQGGLGWEFTFEMGCVRPSAVCNSEGDDPKQILSVVNRALAVLDQEDENKCSMYVALILKLLGHLYIKLSKFDDALGCLNRVYKILVKLLEDAAAKFRAENITILLVDVQRTLAEVKTAMGRREEALDNLRKVLEIKEHFELGKDSNELGNEYRIFARACVSVKNFKAGLPYCLKALEIHLGLLGQHVAFAREGRLLGLVMYSGEEVAVARDRRLLGVIYAGMEEYDKALEENRLALEVLKTPWDPWDWLPVVIEAANMHIALGNDEAAMNMLKEHEKALEKNHVSLIGMGMTFMKQENFADAKRYFEIVSSALGIGNMEKSEPLQVAQAYISMSIQYETMNEFETEISLLKRALACLEMLCDTQELDLKGSVLARIGGLLLLTGKVTQAMPYLESAAKTLEERLDSKCVGLGYVYNNLGAAYLELENPQSAAQMFALSKDILDVCLAPRQNESIHACENLSKAYAAMKSYPLAIEFQQKAVDAWGSRGRSAKDELREARQLLEQLKASACGASSKDYPTKALPLPNFADASIQESIGFNWRN